MICGFGEKHSIHDSLTNKSHHLTYPARRLSNIVTEVPEGSTLIVNGARKCFYVPQNRSDEKTCLKTYDPTILPFYRANTEKKYSDYIILNDVTDTSVTDPFDNTKTVRDILLTKAFIVNDRFSVINFADGYSRHIDQDTNLLNLMNLTKNTFYHLNKTNIYRLNQFMDEKLPQKQSLGDLSIPFRRASEVFSDQLSYKIHSSYVNIIILRSTYTKLPEIKHNVENTLAIIMGLNHPQKNEICNLVRCIVLPNPTNSKYDQSEIDWITEALYNFVLTHESHNSGDRQVTWVKPYDDSLGKGSVISATYRMRNLDNSDSRRASNRYDAVFSMDIDWLVFQRDYCHTENDLDSILAIIEMNYGVFLIQFVGVYLIYLGYFVFILFYEHFMGCIKKNEKLTIVVESFYEMNHVWFILMLGFQSILMLEIVEYSFVGLFVMFLIFLGYTQLWCCGILCLKLKRYKKFIDSKKKENEMLKEELLTRKDNYVRMKGLSLIIDTIEFDDFIKGTFKNFEIKSGELCAVMGHSGAGKSTFFNILLGTYVPKNLRVIVKYIDDDGEEKSTVVSKLNEIKPYISFVPQFEIVAEKMTVFEQLWMQTQQKYKKTDRDVVDYYCQQLGLDGKLKHKFSSELSGGQRKRLSILKELVSSNPVILLDEPTSGLDSLATVQLIENLRQLAQSGLAVVFIIHQPSTQIMRMFDKLYLFLKDQETVTCAQVDIKNNEEITADVIDKFLMNPSDYLERREVKRDEIEKDPRIFQKLFQKTQKQLRNPLLKWISLIPRLALEELRDRSGILTDILISLTTALALVFTFGPLHSFEGRTITEAELCMSIYCSDLDKTYPSISCSSDEIKNACTYPKSNPAFFEIFVLILSIGLISLICSLRIFGGEKHLMKREFRSGVDFFQYYCTKLITQIPRVLLLVFFFLVVVYSSVCFQAPFFVYYIVCVFAYLWVMAIGIICSLLFPKKENSVNSTLIGIVLVLIMNLFSGLFVTQRQTLNYVSESLLHSNEFSQSTINPFSLVIFFLKYLSYSYYGNFFLYLMELVTYADEYPLSVVYNLQEYGYLSANGEIVSTLFFIVFALFQIIISYLIGLFLLYLNYTSDKEKLGRYLSKKFKSFLPKWLTYDDVNVKDVLLRKKKISMKKGRMPTLVDIEEEIEGNFGIWLNHKKEKVELIDDELEGKVNVVPEMTSLNYDGNQILEEKEEDGDGIEDEILQI